MSHIFYMWHNVWGGIDWKMLILYENVDATDHFEAHCTDYHVTVGTLTTSSTCQVINALKHNIILKWM
jgi:hypothetical protein